MKSIRRFSLTDEAVKQIRNEVAAGRYRPGDRLPSERELSEALQIGRSTVREALRVLKAMGIVEIKQGKGAYVKSATSDSLEAIRDWFVQHEYEIIDFMEARASIETHSVRLAAERAKKADIKLLRSILADFEKALEEDDAVALATTDEAFHTAIMRAAHNELLLGIGEEIAKAFRPYRLRSFAFSELALHARDPHRRIMEAIEERDPDKAYEEMVRHLKISEEDIRRVAGEAVEANPE